MATETRQITSTDKDLHLSSYENAPGNLHYVTSNTGSAMPTMAHIERPTPPSTAPDVNALEQAEYAWGRVRRVCQEGFAEFFGTMVMILFGDGSVAQVVLSSNTKGEYQSISWGWG